MPSDLHTNSSLLADVCSDVSYGYTESATTVPVGPKFLRITDIQGGRFDWKEVPYCPATDADAQKYGLKVGDIVVARTGNSTGENAQVWTLDGPAVFASYLIRFRIDPERANPFFVGYQLRTRRFQDYVLAVRGGSAQPGANAKQLGAFELLLPARSHQDAVVGVLRSLDNRIDLLRQTNTTLESIAQALFKSWFIDFDPVRAKAEGREPEGMDAATAALFPTAFDESELGPVPKGWAVQPIGDLVGAIGGSTPDTKNEALWEPAVHHWTSPKDLSGATAPVLLDTERKVSDAGLAKISSGLLPVGTLLMSSRAPIGYLSLSQVPVAINQGYIAMPPGGRLPPEFMYFWCQLNMEVIKGRANGSTFMEISKKAFRPIPALLPSPEVVNRFHDFAVAVFSRITTNERQSRALAELRDTLLPRLISGKLRLPEAIQELEAA